MSQETKVFIGIGIATLLIVIGGAFIMGKPSTPDTPETPADQKLLTKDDSYKIATDSAKVTLVEFGDFQCPACGSAHPIVSQLLKEYKEDITFVFRHFPLPIHKNAVTAAMAAEAAGEQGKFFEMHDMLFENQKEWSDNNDPLFIFENYAKTLDLDVEKFSSDIKSKKYKDKIQQDQNDGGVLGVNSTPTFFINGMIQKGALPYESFKQVIENTIQNTN